MPYVQTNTNNKQKNNRFKNQFVRTFRFPRFLPLFGRSWFHCTRLRTYQILSKFSKSLEASFAIKIPSGQLPKMWVIAKGHRPKNMLSLKGTCCAKSRDVCFKEKWMFVNVFCTWCMSATHMPFRTFIWKHNAWIFAQQNSFQSRHNLWWISQLLRILELSSFEKSRQRRILVSCSKCFAQNTCV